MGALDQCHTCGNTGPLRLLRSGESAAMLCPSCYRRLNHGNTLPSGFWCDLQLCLLPVTLAFFVLYCDANWAEFNGEEATPKAKIVSALFTAWAFGYLPAFMGALQGIAKRSQAT